MSLPIALVGAGFMGQRHIRGLARLKAVGKLTVRLEAVVDQRVAVAEKAAGLAENLLGWRPDVVAAQDRLARAVSGVTAVIVATPPDQHVTTTLAALEQGYHVLVEKPLAVTVAQARRLVEAAEASGRLLAVAENYRRDPLNRLGRALLEAGLIGEPFLCVQSSSSGSDRVIISPWRHRKALGGIALDMGVHYADVLEYFLGPISTVSGVACVVEAVRRHDGGEPVAADAEDLLVGYARFAAGAVGNFVLNLAGRGADDFRRVVYGRAGAVELPPDRSGKPLVVWRYEGGAVRRLADADLWATVPTFALDPVTAALFGADRITAYTLDWETTDANLLAIEQQDFFEAVGTGRTPEVTGRDGLRAVAIINAWLESSYAGREVAVSEVLDGTVHAYQDTLGGGEQP